MKQAAFGIVGGLILLAAQQANATVRFVVPPNTPGAHPESPYASWATAATNVNDIEAVLADGDRVVLSNGVHRLKKTMDMTTHNVQYVGLTGNPDDVVISGEGAFTCCYISGGTNQLVASLTVSNGYRASGGYGAGFMIHGAPNLTIRNCVIANNISVQGPGGITCAGGSPGFRLIDCDVRDNWGYTNYYHGGGGGVNCGNGMFASNCVFSGNSNGAGYAMGGGVYLGDDGVSTSLFFNCLFSNNNAATGGGGGGGGWNDGPACLVNCAFASNMTGNAGGGWCINNSDTIISACDFTNNLAGVAGGGLAYSGDHGGTVENCRFIGNRAGAGGGLSFWYGKGGEVTNCVISDNVAGQGGGVDTSPGGGSLRNCLIARNTATGVGAGVNVCSAWTGYDTLIAACVIVSNTAGGKGAGIMVSSYHLGGFVVTNSIVCFNKAKTDEPAATSRLWLTAARVAVSGSQALVEGKDDVDTDVFVTGSEDLALTTGEKTRTAGSGIRSDGSMGATTTTQIGLLATVPANGALTSVLYPRLKTEQAPVFTSLAGGKGVKVQSGAGTDYVFISATPFTFAEDTIIFSGKSGAIRIRGNQMVLSLGEGGCIGAHGKILESDKAASKGETL